jgi:hypothetical protein
MDSLTSTGQADASGPDLCCECQGRPRGLWIKMVGRAAAQCPDRSPAHNLGGKCEHYVFRQQDGENHTHGGSGRGTSADQYSPLITK